MSAESDPQPLAPERVDALIKVALAARDNAYAPYSRFRVGAALLADDGTLYRGANVENASYGLCICAERTAVSTAVVSGHRTFSHIAIATASSPPSTPCGMCRQVLAEFAPEIVIYLVNPAGEVVHTDLPALFPNNFDARLLADGAERDADEAEPA